MVHPTLGRGSSSRLWYRVAGVPKGIRYCDQGQFGSRSGGIPAAAGTPNEYRDSEFHSDSPYEKSPLGAFESGGA